MYKIEQLQDQINRSIRLSRNPDVKELVHFNFDVMMAQTIIAVDDATINFIPFTAVACRVGREVLTAVESTKIQEFKIGAFLVENLAKIGVIKLNKQRPQKKAGKKQKQDTYFIEVIDLLAFAELVFTVRKQMKELSKYIAVFPQFEKPSDWRSYYHPVAGQMVRNINSKQSTYFTKENAPEVFNLVNKAQSTGWVVNTELLNTLDAIKNDDALFTFSNKNFDDKQRESNVYLNTSILDVAATVGDSVFYNYHYFDSRGRLYCTTNYLSYQGSKLGKSLCKYADKKPLGASGWNFLLAHSSSAFGEDKLSLDARIEFAENHLDEWLVWADDPITHRGWTKTDDPFNFLAAIIEIKNAVKSGDEYSFESNLPIPLDASCSGLMILSALSNDKVSAEHCNLVDTEARGDYYLYIADHLNAFKTDEFWSKHADKRRKIVKRQAMIYFYSAKADCMSDTIYSDWKTELDGLTIYHCRLLGNQIYQACRELMPGPTAMMDGFIEKGLEAYRNGEHYHLDLPNGFRMHQNYTTDKSKKFEITFMKKRVSCRVIVEKGNKINYRKVKSGTSPNVVHSYDAQLVAKAIAENDYLTTTIHDSFSSHACNTGKLWVDLRQQFADFFNTDVAKAALKNEYCYA